MSATVEDVRLKGLLIVALSALLLAATALASSPTIAGKSAVATLKAQNAAFNASNWSALWSAYTANYKSRCGPYSKWVKGETTARKRISGNLTTRVTGNKVVGSKAYLAYQILSGTKVLFTVKASAPDAYLKVNGLWYDEYDSGC